MMNIPDGQLLVLVAQIPHLAGNLWQKPHAQQGLRNRQYSPKSSHLRMRLQDGPRHGDWKPYLGSSRKWIPNTSSKRSGSGLSHLLQPSRCSGPETLLSDTATSNHGSRCSCPTVKNCSHEGTKPANEKMITGRARSPAARSSWRVEISLGGANIGWLQVLGLECLRHGAPLLGLGSSCA